MESISKQYNSKASQETILEKLQRTKNELIERVGNVEDAIKRFSSDGLVYSLLLTEATRLDKEIDKIDRRIGEYKHIHNL